MKTAGIESLKRRLHSGGHTRGVIALKIRNSFSEVDWAKAENREDMNNLWDEWLKVYNALVEKLIGTRWARVSSWGRKFDT